MFPPPAPNFYQVQLTILALFCFTSIALERWVDYTKKKGADLVDERERRPLLQDAAGSAFTSLRRNYLLVYGAVMMADWLQGPYVYSLYREQYGFSERVVGLLFVTGFTAAGLSSPFVGVWADKFGRKRICLSFCVAYAFACMCTLFSFPLILFIGRMVSGFATAILFSAFETWVVSASQDLNVSQAGLSSILGHAMLINGLTAAAAGVVANELVAKTGTHTSPFVLSACFLGLAWIMIRGLWGENYGSQDVSGSDAGGILQLARIKDAFDILRSDPALLVIGLRQTCFEGSMYIFVFLWVPSMQEAAFDGASLPLGYIFSAFMVSMMIGSVVYTSLTAHQPPDAAARDQPLVLHAKLAALNCLAASVALGGAYGFSDTPQMRFWCFCAFEGCVGLYYPLQGMLKGAMVSNDHRATLAALFRVPLNIFVTAIMLTGISSNRQAVFSCCSAVLALSSIATTFVIVPRTLKMEEEKPARRTRLDLGESSGRGVGPGYGQTWSGTKLSTTYPDLPARAHGMVTHTDAHIDQSPILLSFATIARRQSRRRVVFIVLIVVLLVIRLEWAYFYPRLPGLGTRRPNKVEDETLEARVSYAEKVYQETLTKRKELVQRAGPLAEDVEPFPRDLKLHTLWDFFPATFQCPHIVERIGHLGVGGKWVCGIDRLAEKKDCVIYSFGSSWDSSFEAEILKRTKYCKIYGYHEEGSKFGPEVRWMDLFRWRTKFRKYGLHSVDEPPRHRSLASLMFENGHDYVDLIKVDIEGWEFAALSPIFEAYTHTSLPLPFGQLQLEIHASGMPFDKVLEWWQLLESAGLRPFMTEPNMVYVNLNRGLPDISDYSFINIRGDNVFISNSGYSS